MHPMQCSDWNAVSFGDDRGVDRFLQSYRLAENRRNHLRLG
jgi:hypothetical protein